LHPFPRLNYQHRNNYPFNNSARKTADSACMIMFFINNSLVLPEKTLQHANLTI